MQLRRFNVSDAFEVSSLIRKSILVRDNRRYTLEQVYSIANHYSAENICTDLENKVIYVYLENGFIIGTATLYNDEIMAVFIAPEFQGRGIGKKFMDILEKDALNKGLSRVWLVAALPAVSFYEKLEYSFVKEKNHPLWGKGIVMEKYLK